MTETTGTTFESAIPAEDTALTQGAAEAEARTVQVAQAAVEVPMPQPGETVRIPVAAGQTIRFAFDVAEARPSQQDGDLVLEINGGTVVLQGFETATSGEILLEITNADGTVINMADFLVALGISPEAEVLPAAGAEPAGALPGTVPNGGAGFAPGQAPTILGSLDPTGPVDPSALLYRVPEREPRLFELEEEADPAGGEIDSSFTTTIDGGEGGYGYDHPSAVIGEFAGGFEDWAPNQHLGDGSLSPMKLNLSLVPTDNEELVSVTISNIPAGVTIFAPGQMVSGNGGNSITIQAADLDDVYVLPAANTDGDLVLELSAEIRDPDSGIVSDITGTATGVVDAAADKPEDVQADAPSQVGLGTEVTFEVEARFGDWTDGSESHFLLVELPSGWGNPNGYATETFAAGNPWGIPEGVYVRVPATVDGGTAIGTAQLTLQAPVSLPQGTAAETFHFGIVGKAVETPGDGELTAANDVSYTPMGESTQLPEIPVTVVKPTLSIDDVTVHEDDGTATFTVTLHGAVGVSVALGYATADGSARDGDGEAGVGIPDYAATSGTLTFPASDAPSQTLTITVPITDDGIFENPEAFFVDLTGVDGTIVDIPGSDLQGVGTILDDGQAPTVSISDGDPAPQTEGEGATITFTVTLSGPTDKEVTVDFTTVDGTAKAGIDYVLQTGTLTFGPGETSKTVTVTVLNDQVFEDPEAFTVELSNAERDGAALTIADDSGTGSIVDDGQAPTVSISDGDPAPQTEGDGATITFTVTLSGPTDKEVTVDFATVDGTAKAGIDYVLQTGTLTFGPGETSKTVTVTVLNDQVFEDPEAFTVELSNAERDGAALTIADDSGTGSIVDDGQAPTVSISDGDPAPQTEGEGATITFTVTLSGPTDKEVTVDFATVDGTAKAGIDYVLQTGTLTFGPGETSKTITVTVLNDQVFEDPEAFTVELSNAERDGAALVITDDSGTGSIVDDDPAPTVSISDGDPAPQTEGEGATITFTVTLSGPTDKEVTVDFTTVDGTAKAGIDYVLQTGTLTFGPGETSKTVTVTVLNDQVFEDPEAFTVELSNAEREGAALVITDDSGTGSIVDDDPAPTVSISDAQANESDPLVFTVSLSGTSSEDIVLALQAGTPGSADPGTDYETTAFRYSVDGGATWIDAANGNEVTIPAGTTAILVEVDSTEDGLVEPDETMTLSVGSVVSGTLSGWSDTGTGTIVDDDVSFQVTVTSEDATNDLPTQSATIGEETSSDDSGQFQIAMNGFPLSGTAQASVTVTIGGDAAAGAGGDFTQAVASAIQAGAAAAGVGFVDNGNGTVTLTWSAASTSGTVLVDLAAVDDDLAEAVESLTLSLDAPTATGGTASIVAGQDSAELQITDIDNVITFSIAADKEAISEEGAEAATFTLSLGGFPLAAGNTASVEVAAGGTAGADDYGPALLAALQSAVAGLPGVSLIGSTLHFSSAYDGSPISFTVSAIDDSLVEGVETIVASLANASVDKGTATILVPSDTVAITEIDNAVTFSIAVSSEDAANDAGPQSATVSEENASDNLGTFQIAMSGGPLTGSNEASVTVTIGGDAEAGAGGDFTSAVIATIQAGAAAAGVGFVDNGNGTVTLTWTSSSTAQSVEIDLTAFDDNHPDSPETLALSLSDPAITNGSASIGGGQDSASLTVTDDDEYVPDAVSEEVSVVEGSLINYNLMLVIDKSGSMDDDDLLPGPGTLTRLQLAVDALKNMLEAYDSAAGDIQVQIVSFDSNAQGVFPTSGTFYTVEQAIQKLDQIAANGAGGNTDYDDATELAAGAFPSWPDASATQRNIVYFLSDGDPNPNSEALNSTEQAAWRAALDTKGIEVIAVGVGDGITDTSELAKVAYPADNVILVENDTELGAALLGTLPNILTGNVLDNGDSHGGDGWGTPKIVSVEHDGVVYTTASPGYDAASQTLTITTDLGGKLSINFATGEYTYQAPNVDHATTPDPVETFTYTIQDANGDTDSATLTIRIEDGEPTAYDNYAQVMESHLVEQTTLVEGFESSSGWSRYGDAGQSNSHDTQGSRSAVMSTGDDSRSFSSLASNLGLTTNQIQSLLGNGNPNKGNEGSGITKTFSVTTANSTIDVAFDWHFDAAGSGGNDAALYFVKVDGVIVASDVLARRAGGDKSGTETVTLNVTPGSHDVQVIWAVIDVENASKTSTLYVDNLTMTDMVPTTDNVVTGNVIADPNNDPLSGDPVGARDVMGSDGATLTRIDYADAGGNPAFALVPANGASVTVETQNGFLTIDKSGSYSYAAKLNAVTSGAVEQDEFTYTLTDGDGDTDTAKLAIDIHDSVLLPPPEPPSILSGTIVTNTNVANQPLRLTITELGNPLNSFATVLMLDSQGQQTSTLNFAVDVGFDIDNSQQYLVTLTSLNGEKVNVTDFTLEGVTIEDASGNIQLGFPSTGDGLTQVIQPNAPGTAGIPGDDKDVVYSDGTAPFASGPTTADAQAGASVPYIQGTAGDDTLTGSDGIDVIAGGAGNDTIYGGGEMDLLFGDAGDDLLFGGDGDDVIYGGGGNDVIVGGQGADRIDVSEGSDTVVYQSVLDGGDLITGFSASGPSQDFVDLDGLFDSLNGGIEAESRADRVQLVQNGEDVTVNIDVSAGTGAGDGSSFVTLATIHGVSVSDLSVGTAPTDDIQTGAG